MIKILSEKNITPEVRGRINEIANLPGVREVAVFPDVHLKRKYLNLGYRIDIPSSLAILTENCLYPQFRSRGINCGMALIKTNLSYQDSLLPELEKVLLGFSGGLIKNLFNLFRFPLSDKFSLSTAAFQEICQKELPRFDYSGIRPEWQKGTLRLKRKMGRHFGGNHFLEIQVVDEVFDEQKAAKYGIEKGQIFILYHTAGEGLDDILEERILKEVIYQSNFVRVDKSSPHFSIVLKAIKILMNYGFAYRDATLKIISELFVQTFGREAGLERFGDWYHNGVEQLRGENGQDLFLYRHNVNKVVKDAPALLSGSFNLRSYVSEGGTGARNFLNSADHGYGDLIKNFPGTSSDFKVKRILFKKGVNLPFFVKKEQISLEHNAGADYLLSLFEKNDISKRIFSLRPIINLKFI